MAVAQTHKQTLRKPLRVWPGVVAVTLLWLSRLGVKAVVPGFRGFELGMKGALLGVAAVVLWWLFFSRARWSERLVAILLMIVALGGTWGLNHESMGPLWLVGYAIPVLCLALVAWAVATRRLARRPRRAAMVATILLACGVWTLVRMEGITGDHVAQFAWRWTETAEERVVALAADQKAALPSASAPAKAGNEWPGFRGPHRNGVVTGVRIETEWSTSPPTELWRRPIGPGWSSFAVRGDLLYTQEQRGDDEIVACYKASTGEPVWLHRDSVRFFESNGGAGPRATPTLGEGRVYTFGATGILNALDAGSGAVVWSRDAASAAAAEVPYWGFSSSPLVVDGLVVVAVDGALVAYDLATGAQRWSSSAGGHAYSSPHLGTIGGVAQILLLSGAGATGVAPNDGDLLWKYPWPSTHMIQPALTPDGDVLIATQGTGTRRLAIARGPGGWTVKERWTSIRLKPYFNDFVLHKGHAYGFDGRILACIDLEDGKRKWKGGRYGNGQLILLSDQDLLLVVSDEGELALAAATPDRFTELARFQAIKGKTWNHPALAGDVLLVRNGREMAAFRLILAGD